jgi:sigma-B regulation protein RsbU (phosphoserine phosphatase)
MTQRKTTFRTKLLVALLALTGLLTLTLMLLVWKNLRDLPSDVTRAMLDVKLAQAERHLAAFHADISDLSAHFSTQSPAYARLHDELLAIAQPGSNPSGFGRTMSYDVYLVDQPGPGGPTHARLLVTLKIEESGRPYDMTRYPGMLDGWKTLTVDTAPQEDEYGLTLSGYAPIRKPAGQTIALLGIDAPEADISLSRKRLLYITAAGAAIALLGSGVFAYLLALLFNRPVSILARGMARVEQGDLMVVLTSPGTVGGPDEFNLLIPQFNRMVDGLRDRAQMRRSLEVAAGIQNHLLPKEAPIRQGYDFYAGADYCDETGGDYYDWIELPNDDAVGMVVADVAGHGIASALVMTSARGVLRSHAPSHGHDPSALLRAVNTHLVRDVEVQKFVTLFYAALFPATRELRWSSAGHEKGVLLRADGSVAYLDTTGTPLAILENEPYTALAIILAPGDLLLVPTDGIRECRNAANEFFETDRLIQTARDVRHLPARDIHARILQTVHSFRGPNLPQQDDITLLVVKVL